MKIELDIPENELEWEDNCYLRLVHTDTKKSSVAIEANKEGLISLAKQLLVIAYSEEDINVHHWAEKNTDKGHWYGDLDEGSLDLSIAKIDKKGRKN